MKTEQNNFDYLNWLHIHTYIVETLGAEGKAQIRDDWVGDIMLYFCGRQASTEY